MKYCALLLLTVSCIAPGDVEELEKNQRAIIAALEKAEAQVDRLSKPKSPPASTGPQRIFLAVQPQGDCTDDTPTFEFKHGKAELQGSKNNLAALSKAAAAAKAASGLIEVGVHTDARGSSAYNLKLSAERAKFIKAKLIERGVKATRISSQGFGESQPIIDNSGCNRSRRVELIARPQ